MVSRLKRDILERGRDLEGVLKQYNRFVKPVRMCMYICVFVCMYMFVCVCVCVGIV